MSNAELIAAARAATGETVTYAELLALADALEAAQARITELEQAELEQADGITFDEYKKRYGVVGGATCRKCGASLTCPCLDKEQDDLS